MDHNRNCDFVSHPKLIRQMCYLCLYRAQGGQQSEDRQPWRPTPDLLKRPHGPPWRVVVHAEDEGCNRIEVALGEPLKRELSVGRRPLSSWPTESSRRAREQAKKNSIPSRSGFDN